MSFASMGCPSRSPGEKNPDPQEPPQDAPGSPPEPTDDSEYQEAKEAILSDLRARRKVHLACIGIHEVDASVLEDTLGDELIIYQGIAIPCGFEEAICRPIGINEQIQWEVLAEFPEEASWALRDWIARSHIVRVVWGDQTGGYSVTVAEYQTHGKLYKAQLILSPVEDYWWEHPDLSSCQRRLKLPEGLSARIERECRLRRAGS